MKTRVFSSQRKRSRWGGNFRSYFEGLAVVLEEQDSEWGIIQFSFIANLCLSGDFSG